MCTACACECACTCECAPLPTAFQTALETGLENAYFEYLWGNVGDRMRKDQVSTLAAAGVTLASGWRDWAAPSRGTEASRGEEVHTLWGPSLLPSALQVPLSPADLRAGQTLIGTRLQPILEWFPEHSIEPPDPGEQRRCGHTRHWDGSRGRWSRPAFMRTSGSARLRDRGRAERCLMEN